MNTRDIAKLKEILHLMQERMTEIEARAITAETLAACVITGAPDRTGALKFLNFALEQNLVSGPEEAVAKARERLRRQLETFRLEAAQ